MLAIAEAGFAYQSRTFAARSNYKPQINQINRACVDEAIREFKRRAASIEASIRVVVAWAIPLHDWKNRSLSFRSARYEVTCSDPDINDQTTVQVVITELQGVAHQQVVSKISTYLDTYATATGGVLAAGGGIMYFAINQNAVERIPDEAIRPIGRDPVPPNVIVEVEMGHSPLPGALHLAREYFDGIPELRAMVLIKIYPRRSSRRLACLAILFRRNARGLASFDDVVSFGNAPLANGTRGDLNDFAPQIHVPLRNLPQFPALRRHQFWQPVPSPWDERIDRPFMSVPNQDVFFPGAVPNIAPPDGIRIHLWPLIILVDNCVP